jgi:hypothetical protein
LGLREALQTVIAGPGPSDGTREIAEQLGPNNELGTYMLQRHWGTPGIHLIQAAANLGLNKRQQDLQEKEFDTNTTTADPSRFTENNPYFKSFAPGQRVRWGVFQGAVNAQDNLNQEAKSNAAIDATRKYLQDRGVDPNDMALLATDPTARYGFTPAQIGEAVSGTLANNASLVKRKTMADSFLQGFKDGDPSVDSNDYFILSHPDKFDEQTVLKAGYGLQNYTTNKKNEETRKQQLQVDLANVVNSIPDPTIRARFMAEIPQLLAYGDEKTISNFMNRIDKFMPEPLNALQQEQAENYEIKNDYLPGFMQAQTADEIRDANQPYGRGGGGGEGGSSTKLSPQDRTFLSEIQNDYKSWYKTTGDGKGGNGTRQQHWTIEQYLRKYRPADYQRWRQLTAGNSGYAGASGGSSNNAQPAQGVSKIPGYQKNNYYTNDDWNRAGVIVKKYGSFRKAWQYALNAQDRTMAMALLDRYNMINHTQYNAKQLAQKLNK